MDHPPSTGTSGAAATGERLPSLDELPDGVVALDRRGVIVGVNEPFLRMVDRPRHEVMQCAIDSIVADEDMLHLVGFTAMFEGDPLLDCCIMFVSSSGERQPLIVCSSASLDHIVLTTRATGSVQRELADTSRWAALEQGRADALAEIRDALAAKNADLRAAQDDLNAAVATLQSEMQARERLENELRLAQKLEAIGQLAAGVAHEINTPMQYVGDNVEFLTRAFAGLAAYLEIVGPVVEQSCPETRDAVLAARKRLRLEYLLKESPRALAASRDGIDHVSTIVRAMKSFAHVDHGEMTAGDINRTISDTLIVAQNEYKHLARVETSFGELPPVQCFVGKLNQVFLNLVVNAAHAIADAKREGGGVIRIVSRAVDDCVEITIADTGCGIAEEDRQRVFDQFFTTKDVGRGTGQGLALARGIIVDVHGGTIGFDSELGVGTTFTIRLPVAGPAPRC